MVLGWVIPDYFWVTLIIAIVIIIVIAYCYKTGATYDRFKKDGVRTEARILNMEKIGATGTGNTKLKMDIEFDTDSGQVTTTAKEYISHQNMVKIMRNNTIYIYYMPNNPKEIFLAPFEMK